MTINNKVLGVIGMLMFFSGFTIPALATVTTVSVSDASADSGTSIDIPIEITNAQSISAMDITLNYNSSVLNAIEGKNGTLTSGSMVLVNPDQLGTVAIGIIDAYGFSGNGTIAVITFNVTGKAGETSALELSSVNANDVNLTSVAVSTKNGTFTVSGPTITPSTPPTETPTETATAIPSPTPTATPTVTETPTETATAIPSPTPTATPTVTETPTETTIEETSPTPAEAAPGKRRKIPSFEAIFAIAGLLLIAYLIRGKDN